MKNIDINKSGDLKIENGDFVIEDGDFATHDFVHTNIDLYYHLATKSFNKGLEENKIHLPNVMKLPKESREQWQMELHEFLQQYFVQTVIFSALSIEALINYYGTNRLEESTFNENERINTLKKFKLFPALALNEDKQTILKRIQPKTMQKIDDLMKSRDGLVHFKTKTTNFTKSKALHHITIEQATDSINTVKLACDLLCELDAQFNFSFDKHVNCFNTTPFNFPEKGWWADFLTRK